MIWQFTRALVIGIIMASAATSTVQTQSLFEQLVMPAPVVAGHAKLEKDCGNCHEPFSRRSQTRLCLACHKEIATDRSAGKGFHGRQLDAKIRNAIIVIQTMRGEMPTSSSWTARRSITN